MKIVSIGKGMCRIVVRSKEKRAKLSKIPEVLVEGNRIIFPEWMTGNIRMIMEPPRKKKQRNTMQSNLL